MVALDPLNRRATRRTFISRASKGARRVAAERERRKRRGRKREDEEKGVGGKGRKGGPRAPQQCGIWRVLVPSNTRCSSAAGCIISRFSHEAACTARASYRVASLFLSSPSVTCAPRIAAPLRSKMRPVPSSSCLSCFPFPPPPPCSAPSVSVIRVIGRGFSGIKLQRRKKKTTESLISLPRFNFS